MNIKLKSFLVCLMLIVLVFATVLAVNAADALTDSTEQVTMTVTKDGQTTTKQGSFDAIMSELDSASTETNANAVITIDVNKDFTIGGAGWWALENMSPTATLNIDLNGHTVTSNSGNVIQNRTAYTLNVDGADDNGNIGTWCSTGATASAFYMQWKSGDNARANIENINIVSTNLSSASQPVVHLQCGITTMKNVKITYTGTAFPTNGTIEDKYLIALKERAKLVLEDCILEDKSSGNLNVYGIYSDKTATFTMNNTTVSAYGGFNCATGSNVITNSKVSVTSDVFLGGASFTVTDSELVTAQSTFSSTTGNVTFNYGEGNTSVTIASESALTGNFIVEEGYSFIPYGNGKYVLKSDEQVTVTIAKDGATTIKHGSFDAIMSELDSASTETNANAVITIDVNKDFTVGGKGWWELKSMSPTATLNFNLNGHTVTSNSGNVIQNRTAYTLNVDGADDNGNIGTWISIGGGASPFYMQVNAGDNARANIQNINIVSTNLSTATQPVVHLQCGITTMKNVKITYTGTDFPTNGTIENKYLIALKVRAKLVLEDCILEDKSSGKLNVYGILSENTATFTMNNTTVSAYGGFNCATGSNVITNSKVSVKSDVFLGGASFTVTDSELVTAQSTFSSTTGNVTFNYGEGNTSVTIASESALTGNFIVEEGYGFIPYGNGKYVLEKVEEVTVTIVKDGVTTTKQGNFDAIMSELDSAATSESENAVITIDVNKDFTVGGKGWWELKSMSPTATLNFNLNGHTVTAKAGNVIQVRTAYTLNVDGADDNGNIGTWIAIGGGASPFYMQVNAGDNARANIQNINIVSTNLSTATQPVVHLQCGITTMKNVKITYTGTDFPTNGTIENKYLIALKVRAKLVLEDCILEDKSSGKLNVYGILSENTATFTMNNTTVSAYGGFNCASGTDVITNSKVTVTSDVFLGGASFTVTDSELITAQSTFSSTTGNITFNYGEGNTFVTIANGSALTGNFIVEEGYDFIPYGNGKYVLGSDSGLSTVKMTSIFSDGMVFQRDMPINVFGTCRKIGAEIKVTLGGETVIAVVDSTGNFKATFGARSAAKGLTLTVEQLGVDTPTVLTYTDVAIGEVIVISGQSNAAYELYKMEDAAEYIANADSYSSIKVFRSPTKWEFYEIEEGIGSWYTVTSELLKKSSVIGGDVSAIGYVLATRMADELGDDVAIALIDASYTGSGIYSWIEFNSFKEEFTGTSYYGAQSGINRYNDYVSFYLKNGRYPTSADEVSSYNEKPYKNTPGVCYNTMIAPIEGYTAKCVVWYQGEENCWSHIDTYGIFFDALKENYKKAFSNDDLKFFAVQLAPDTFDHSDFRATQYNLAEADDTFVISTSREGPVFNATDLVLGAVHPSRKSPVGHRLADSILKNVYGFYTDDVVEAPKVVCVTANGNKLIVIFDTDIYLSYGNVLEGFEIAGADKKFKAAVGEISGNIVTLTATGVDSPEYVRYAYGCMQLVLSDGTVLPYNPGLSNSIGTDKAVIIGPDGTEYVFDGDPSLVIETRYAGNLTNESEHPMPTFMLEVGYGELNISGMKANLSLYSDFKINLYVPAKYAPCIISINGETLAKNEDGTYVTVTLDGIEYVTVSVSKVASDASTKAVFKILLSNGIERTVSISITDYAERILSGGYTEADETLMVYMLKYILAAEKYFCGSENGAIVALIANRYDPDFIDNNYSNGVIENMNLSEVFSDASIVLEDAPVFKFTLDKDKAFKGTITVTYGVNTKIFNVDKSAGEEYSIKVNGMKIYNFGVKLTITATPDEGEVVVGYCNLATYADYHYNNAHDYDSLTREESEEALPLIEALYEYVKVSEMYKKGTLAK